MQQYCMQPPFGLKGDVDVEIGMETEDVHHEMKQMEMLHRHFKPDAKYLKVVTCCALSRRPPSARISPLPAAIPTQQYRRLLVDWMCEVGDELQLHNCTMHVAVSLAPYERASSHDGDHDLPLPSPIAGGIFGSYSQLGHGL